MNSDLIIGDFTLKLRIMKRNQKIRNNTNSTIWKFEIYVQKYPKNNIKKSIVIYDY